MSKLLEQIVELEMKPLEMRPKLGLPNGTTFGCEIEFCDAMQMEIRRLLNRDVPRWLVYDDASVVNERCGFTTGGEITTPILKDEENSWKQFEKVCDILNEEDATTGNNAGGHVHIGSQIIGQDKNALYKFLKLWTAYEPEIYRFAYGDKVGARSNIDFASPIGEYILPKFSRLDKIIKDCSFLELKDELPRIRRLGVNFLNYHCDGRDYKDTIEFRCPNGTINPVVWQNNVNLFVKMLDACKDDRIDMDIVNHRLKKVKYCDTLGAFLKTTNVVNLEAGLELSNHVFKDETDKTYFLKQYVKYFKEPKGADGNITPYEI